MSQKATHSIYTVLQQQYWRRFMRREASPGGRIYEYTVPYCTAIVPSDLPYGTLSNMLFQSSPKPPKQ